MAYNINLKKEHKLKKTMHQWTKEQFDAAGVNPDALKALEMQLVGQVVLPGTPNYDADRQGKGLSTDQQYPQLIVYCEVIHDVWLCLQWAQQYGLAVVCRAGGHSTANYSVNNGMVIDVSSISYVVIDREKMVARVGAGTQFHAFESVLDTFQVHVPTGGCPDVAVSGYMMGGGYGFTSREFGIQSDCVLSVMMMLSDGKIVVANQEQNSDLYWAVRGGTGNNFGVLLEVTYQLFDVPQLWGFVLQWPIEQAADAFVLLQEKYMKGTEFSRLGYQLILTHKNVSSDGSQNAAPEPILAMAAMYHGSREEGMAVIGDLLKTGTPEMSTDQTGTYQQLNDALMDFLPGIPQVSKPVYEEKDGGYIREPISKEGWQQIVAVYKKTPCPYNIAYCEVYGGAINTYPVKKSAFIHRDNYTDFYIDSFWSEDAALPGQDAAKEWLEEYMQVLQPLLSGHKYQNYPKSYFTNYRWEYWGDAYNSLLFVKQKYDPSNFFHYPQSITPYPEDKGITRSEVPSMFLEKGIVYEAYSNGFELPKVYGAG